LRGAVTYPASFQATPKPGATHIDLETNATPGNDKRGMLKVDATSHQPTGCEWVQYRIFGMTDFVSGNTQKIAWWATGNWAA
jgi:hypothetical protein